ncbi:MAG: CDP-glycerol glycerophosphotransferase family protein [Arachidicoccus sp.]|nr:CDP-glycerol glycerophosphotransferase family protein [Arachidicoccus sp.]
MQYKFLIFLSYSYGMPIALPLELEILKRGYEVKWVTYIEETKKSIPSASALIYKIEDAVAYKPHIVLVIADYAPDFISGLKVQLFHGFNSDKRSINDHFNIRGFFDLYCTQGPSTTEKFKALQKKHPHFDVIETGWSKMDPLFQDTTKIINEIPVIMIASTFTERLSLALKDDVYEEIKRLSQKGKYKFLCVLHPKLSKDIVTKWNALNNENFEFIDTTDLIPLFKKADILFADSTSAIQEFMLTEKPIVTFRHNRPLDAYINISEVAEIENAFDYALTYPQKNIDAIKKIADENHPYKDGKSSERVIDACIYFLHKDKSYLNKKPLNIIRKYKIRKMLGYFTFKTYRKPYTIPK